MWTLLLGVASARVCRVRRCVSWLEPNATSLSGCDDVRTQSNATLTVALLYYDQPTLLKKQLAVINTYPRVAVIVIDDASSEPASVEEPVRVYRILDDKKWNIGGARNLAFHVAPTRRVLLLDIDTIAPRSVILTLMKFQGTHRFNRQRPNGTFKISPAAALIDRDAYWRAGGCDEDFVGHYGYTDVHFWYRFGANWTFHEDLVLYEIEHAHERRDTRVNRHLLYRKKSAGSWSNDYLRFRFEDCYS